MSFILDALKKSESDRQRQSGPALFEVKIAPPKARFPLWAIAIAVLLGVNMVVVGWLLLRHRSEDVPTASSAATASATGTPPAGTNYAASTPPEAGSTGPYSHAGPSGAGGMNSPYLSPGASGAGVVTSGGYPGPGAGSPNMAPGGTNYPSGGSSYGGGPANGQGANAPPNTGAPGAPLPGSGRPATGMTDMSTQEPTLAAGQYAGTNTDSAPAGNSNPDDFAPAADPVSTSPFKGHVRRGTESGLTLYQDAAVVPGSNIPELRLDLHVYAAKPQDRFALINMRKMHEGDTLPNGVRVESIIPDGVVMSHNGSRFLLPRD